MAKIGRAGELGCDHVRKRERQRRVDGSCKAVFRCIVVTVFNEVGGSLTAVRYLGRCWAGCEFLRKQAARVLPNYMLGR